MRKKKIQHKLSSRAEAVNIDERSRKILPIILDRMVYDNLYDD